MRGKGKWWKGKKLQYNNKKKNWYAGDERGCCAKDREGVF